ncbi:MAG: Gfo/Idh/MocA family oxidoreductase [Roseiflexaceae bacterium]
MPARLRVAIVGCGIGASHAQGYTALPEQYDLAAICDIDEPKARQFASNFGIEHVITSFDALCERNDLDIIDVCTPPHLHVPQVLQVIASGKHAICEKPIGGSVQDVDRLIAAAAQSGKQVMPIFQYRFGNGLQKLKHLIAAGIAGRAYTATIETHWRRRAGYYDLPWRGKWKTELGGALLGHAIHAHDILNYVLGPTRRVYCHATTLVNAIEVEDTAAAALEMADGSLASLSVTLGASDEISRHRYVFSGLTAESNRHPYASGLGDPWTFTGDTPAINQQINDVLASFEPQPEGFAGQFLRFSHALANGTLPPVTLADARASLELVTAFYDSARRRQPVDLPITADHPLYASWLPA